ncbi:hypothetical protein J6590_007526 [Homalodisca vitripennis]|nr:hypothetical protein J6590_007526 [Homalodisca vitripennis]
MKNDFIRGEVRTIKSSLPLTTGVYNTFSAVVSLECVPSAIISHLCRRVTATELMFATKHVLHNRDDDLDEEVIIDIVHSRYPVISRLHVI